MQSIHVFRKFVALALPMLILGCASSTPISYSPPPTPIFEKQIIPGQRIGPIALGMTPGDVLRILGSPKPGSIIGGAHSIYH
jgi:hypothetical protein